MAMIFTDGFDSYSGASSLRNRYPLSVSNTWEFQATAGRLGGGAAVFPASGTAFRLGPLGNLIFQSLNLVLGFWIKISSAPASITNFLTFLTVPAGTGFGLDSSYSIAVNTSGVIRHNSGTATNGTTNICDNSWHWVELRAGASGSSTYRCYVDTVEQWNLTQNIIPASNGFKQFYFLGVPSRTVSIDDWICYDNNTGLPQLASFPLGECIITTMRPAADDAVQFEHSSGSVDNADAVNEVALDLNDWVSSDGVGAQDLYFYDWVPPSPLPAAIHTAMLTSYMVNPSTGQVQRNHLCSSRGTQETESAVRLRLQATYQQSSFPVDPYTAAAWESDALGAASFGIKVAS